jgi:hypothetical protein
MGAGDLSFSANWICAFGPSTARFFDAHSLSRPEDSRDRHSVEDRLLTVQVFEIGGTAQENAFLDDRE